jgi:hypothetical protein
VLEFSYKQEQVKEQKMTYGDLAIELGFKDDFNGFLTWADLNQEIRPFEDAPKSEIDMCREALAATPQYDFFS